MARLWVLLWSKYSADEGLYPYHIEELEEYIKDGWMHHNTWRDEREQSHDNLWVVLHIGTYVEAQDIVDRLLIQGKLAAQRIP